MRGRLYLDLDGVVTDFEKHYLDKFGHRHDSVSDEEMWKNIHSDIYFFRDAPPIPGAEEFFLQLQERWYDIKILTACPRANYENAARQKRQWVRQHLSNYVDVIPMLHGKYKKLFMHRPGDILIDDFVVNIKGWNEEGGRGYLFKGDYADCLRWLDNQHEEEIARNLKNRVI